MTEKSVLVPLDADQTFALLTEAERLRRWQVLSARLDLRAGGDFRWAVVPDAPRRRHLRRGRARQAPRLHLWVGG